MDCFCFLFVWLIYKCEWTWNDKLDFHSFLFVFSNEILLKKKKSSYQTDFDDQTNKQTNNPPIWCFFSLYGVERDRECMITHREEKKKTKLIDFCVRCLRLVFCFVLFCFVFLLSFALFSLFPKKIITSLSKDNWRISQAKNKKQKNRKEKIRENQTKQNKTESTNYPDKFVLSGLLNSREIERECFVWHTHTNKQTVWCFKFSINLFPIISSSNKQTNKRTNKQATAMMVMVNILWMKTKQNTEYRIQFFFPNENSIVGFSGGKKILQKFHFISFWTTTTMTTTTTKMKSKHIFFINNLTLNLNEIHDPLKIWKIIMIRIPNQQTNIESRIEESNE